MSTDDLSDIWPKELDGRLQPERVIARGGFATVARAWHVVLERAVAVKILHPEHVKDPVVRSRFLQEAQVVAKLDHPHVVKMLDYGASETHAWIVLPFVEGESLRARITTAPLQWREAAKFGREIASAMQAIHLSGVVHRDLKPENVLIDNDNRSMLTDFGMSKPRRSGVTTGAGVILGTPGYIAPEAVKESPVSPASDMYSLGILLWEMTAGFRPFERNDPHDKATTRTRMEELMAARDLDPPRLGAHVKDVPRSLEGLVARLLERSPIDRPRADQVIEELAWMESGATSDLPRGEVGLATVRVTRPSRTDEASLTASAVRRRTANMPSTTKTTSKAWPTWAWLLIGLLTFNVLLGLWLALRKH